MGPTFLPPPSPKAEWASHYYFSPHHMATGFTLPVSRGKGQGAIPLAQPNQTGSNQTGSRLSQSGGPTVLKIVTNYIKIVNYT